MVTKREAAAIWITTGICQVVLSQLFWKKGVESMGPDVDEQWKDESLPSKVGIAGMMYGGVGYFGYIQGYQKGPFAVGVTLTALNLIGAVTNSWRGNNFVGWFGIFDLVKFVGLSTILYTSPLLSQTTTSSIA